MTKLVILFFFLIVSGGLNAQSETKHALSLKPELDIEIENTVELQIFDPSSEIANKNLSISSAARKSTIIKPESGKGTNTTHKSGKYAANLKSMAQARRPSLDGRPAQINIPVIPLPSIAKPNRMSVPNRRISLPIGKT